MSSNNKLYKCSYCDFTTNDYNEKKNCNELGEFGHWLVHTDFKEEWLKYVKKNNKKYKCSYCEFTTKKYYDINYHYFKLHHNEDYYKNWMEYSPPSSIVRT